MTDDLNRLRGEYRAKCTALLDRAERAETERDRLEADWGNAGHDLAALRAAVTTRADQWEGQARQYPTLGRQGAAAELRSLLAAAPTETEETPDE